MNPLSINLQENKKENHFYYDWNEEFQQEIKNTFKNAINDDIALNKTIELIKYICQKEAQAQNTLINGIPLVFYLIPNNFYKNKTAVIKPILNICKNDQQDYNGILFSNLVKKLIELDQFWFFDIITETIDSELLQKLILSGKKYYSFELDFKKQIKELLHSEKLLKIYQKGQINAKSFDLIVDILNYNNEVNFFFKLDDLNLKNFTDCYIDVDIYEFIKNNNESKYLKQFNEKINNDKYLKLFVELQIEFDIDKMKNICNDSELVEFIINNPKIMNLWFNKYANYSLNDKQSENLFNDFVVDFPSLTNLAVELICTTLNNNERKNIERLRFSHFKDHIVEIEETIKIINQVINCELFSKYNFNHNDYQKIYKELLFNLIKIYFCSIKQSCFTSRNKIPLTNKIDDFTINDQKHQLFWGNFVDLQNLLNIFFSTKYRYLIMDDFIAKDIAMKIIKTYQDFHNLSNFEISKSMLKYCCISNNMELFNDFTLNCINDYCGDKLSMFDFQFIINESINNGKNDFNCRKNLFNINFIDFVIEISNKNSLLFFKNYNQGTTKDFWIEELKNEYLEKLKTTNKAINYFIALLYVQSSELNVLNLLKDNIYQNISKNCDMEIVKILNS